MEQDDIMKQEYADLVKQWAARNDYEMSERSINMAAKVLMHRDDVLDYDPGQFIQALFSNDLRGVMNRADEDTWKHFKYIYQAWYNVDSSHIACKYLINQN